MTDKSTPPRTTLSLAMEAYWRGLPRLGKVPGAKSFDLIDIPELLPNLILIEVATEPAQIMTVTYAGSTICERSGFDITGIDYREIYEPHVHEALWNSTQRMIEHPCGHYQLTEVHYQNAATGVAEGTSFPVSGAAPDRHLIVGITDWIGFGPSDDLTAPVKVSKTISRRWVDIGYGIPVEGS